MITFEEYKAMAEKIMLEIYEADAQRLVQAKNLKIKFTELAQTGEIGDSEKFAELLDELSDIIDLTENRYKL